MSTMLLFTTMPASATMPVPVMMIEKGCSITTMPISTPVVERITARSTSAAL